MFWVYKMILEPSDKNMMYDGRGPLKGPFFSLTFLGGLLVFLRCQGGENLIENVFAVDLI